MFCRVLAVSHLPMLFVLSAALFGEGGGKESIFFYLIVIVLSISPHPSIF